MRSRPQSQTNIEGIQEADEAISTMEKLESEPAELNKIKIEVGQGEKEVSYTHTVTDLNLTSTTFLKHVLLLVCLEFVQRKLNSNK